MSRARRTQWTATILAALVATLLGLSVVRVGHRETGAATHAATAALRPAPSTARHGVARTQALQPAATAVAVLHRWDARRAAAWASGSPARLRALYLPGSSTGAADVRLLRRYRARGLRVTGMRTQILAAPVLRGGPGRWTLQVTDRLAGAVAVHDGRWTTLPRDSAGTTVVTLVRRADGWRVASVTEVSVGQVSAAPPRDATRASGGRR